MSSSISSSDASTPDAVLAEAAVSTPGRLRRVLLVLVLGLLALEAVTRVKLFHMSKDFVQFATYPERAATLSGHDGSRVAVVGNSITHEDIDAPLLSERLHGLTGVRTNTDVFSVDHSYIETWHYVLGRYFWKPGRRVDLVVVPFWGTNLYDGNELEIGRLAQFFTTVADWPDVLAGDLSSNSERADFLVSSFWATLAARDRMRELAFTTGLPDYKAYARREQDVVTNQLVTATAGRPKRTRTVHALKRFLRDARSHGTAVVFIVFPTLHTDWDDEYVEIRRLIDQAGMRFLDLRAVPDLDETSYVDLVHMNETGRTTFTRRLAEALAPLLRCEGPDCGLRAAAADTPATVVVD